MQFIEDYRNRAFEHIFKIDGFRTAWRSWGPEAAKLTDDFSDASKVFELGTHLSSIFKSTAPTGRSQATVSTAGGNWEALVAWYLNVVLSGTPGVAIKQLKALVPDAISDAMAINYGNETTNTESDVLGFVLPEEIALRDAGEKPFAKSLSEDIGPVLHKIDVVNIQCKTNWNDNAQIPMLWDIVYSAKGFHSASITNGINGFSVRDFNQFRYAFATVPSQKKPIKPNSMPVRRVSGLSGGNYWGQASLNGVASGLPEIFKRNFGRAFNGSVKASIQQAIDSKVGWFDYISSLD